MGHTTNVRLVKVEGDSYILRAEDGSSEYVVPIAACDLLDGLIIPVDINKFIRVCLLPPNQESVAKAGNVENNCSLLTEDILVTPTSSKKKWLSATIKNLLYHYSEKRPLFLKTSIRSDEVWKQIQTCMGEDGFHFTIEQIKTKFSKLKQNYMKVKDNNSQTGAAPMDFPWLDEFDSIFSKNHDVEPVATASSSSFTPINEGSLSKTTIIRKHNKTNCAEKILAGINKMRDDREVREQQRAQERKEERQRILDEIRRGNDLFEKVLNKLAEKK